MGLVRAEELAQSKQHVNGEDKTPEFPAALDWERLEESGDPPARDWILDNWVGMGHVTLLSGLGGIGKSILAQQMATGIALGRPFIANVKQPRRVLGWMGEDDEREIWARQIAVCAKFDVPLSALRGLLDLHALDRYECCLLEPFQGKMIRTNNLTHLREQIGDLRAELVLLDNVARLFGGNENDRHQVSSFFAALQWAAEPTRAGIQLLGHVSKMQQSEFSGSTAWENAARARLWFADHPPDKKPDPDADNPPEDLRYLAKRKVNYTSRDLAILRYVDGAYDVITSPAGGLVANIERGQALGKVRQAISRLNEMQYIPSDARSSPNFLPKLMMAHDLAGNLTREQLTRAMTQLITEGEIVRTIEKCANRITDRIRLVLK